ncbi:MAG: hypothetical protein BYD32DRAFT_75999 [Podila humilis]|nr:MAG: hypothetical protein BYD32DRAFT_75999 [Podila humilis]
MPRNILAGAALSMALAALVFACSDDDTTTGCRGTTPNEGWKNTQDCMEQLGITSDCYCWSNSRYFAIANTNYEEFQACCNLVWVAD